MKSKNLFKILYSHDLWLKSWGRKGCRANLSFMDLQGVCLEGFNLSGALMIGTNLKASNLRNCAFKYAFISHSDLRGANLTETDFSHAALIKVKAFQEDFSNSILTGTHFYPLKQDEEAHHSQDKIKTAFIIISKFNIHKE